MSSLPAYSLSESAIIINDINDATPISSSYRHYIARNEYSTAMERSIQFEMTGDELFKLRKYELAQRYYNKTIEIEEAILGKDHPVFKSLLEKLAMTDVDCWQRSSLRKASAVLHEGLQMEKQGDYLLKLGNKDRAKEEYEHVLKIEEAVLGEQHPITISLQQKIILSTK
jgi:tetratricopeptide (TPR) repeat protein